MSLYPSTDDDAHRSHTAALEEDDTVTAMAIHQTARVSCPECNAPHTLVWIGQYGQDARPWLQWASTVTHYYMCLACQAVTPLVEIQGRSAATHDEMPARDDAFAVERPHPVLLS